MNSLYAIELNDHLYHPASLLLREYANDSRYSQSH